MSPPMTSKTRSTSPRSSQRVVLEVDELLRAEVERLLSVGGASGPDDVGAGLGRELGHHRSDRADRAMREDALPRLEPPWMNSPCHAVSPEIGRERRP